MQRFIAGLLVVSSLAACGGDTGTGSVSIRISGEDGAKEGFPLTEGEETIAFADGWSIRFTKYLVAIGQLSLAGSDGEVAIDAKDVYVADLVKGDPELATYAEVPARRWERFGFALVAPTAAAKNANGVAQADLDRMVQGGFNYWVEGSATKGARTVTFAWGWKNPTANKDCTNGDDGKEGLVVSANSATEAEITLHVEHAFWDSLGDEEAKLRFDAIAAKADESGHVTMEALAGQPLASPVDADGQPLKDESGATLVYDPGSIPLSQNNLAGFIQKSAAGQAHLNGEGLCTIAAQ